MDKKIKKLAEFSSVHPARLIGSTKIYENESDKQLEQDKIGQYYFQTWEEKHPNYSKNIVKFVKTAGVFTTPIASLGMVAGGALTANPVVAGGGILLLIADMALSGTSDVKDGPFCVFPIGTTTACLGTFLAQELYHTAFYAVTLPARLVAKGVLNHEINKQNKILSLENGAEILENYQAEQEKNKQLKFQKKMDLKNQKSLKLANQVVEETQKLKEQNQELEQSK